MYVVEDIMLDCIAALGIAASCAHLDHQPDTDVSAGAPHVLFRETGGPANRLDAAWFDQTIQVLVTSPPNDPETGRDLAENIYNRYHGATNMSLTEHLLDYAEGQQPVYPLGLDDRNREQFVFNLLVSGKRS